MEKTFSVGSEYACRSICDHDCIFRFTVTKRTAKSVWLKSAHRPEQRRTIRTDADGTEWCEPHGRYSMSPSLRADKPSWAVV